MRREPESDSQAEAPVRQNQVRQREHHMQFGALFSSAFVSGFTISKQSLYNAEDMLHLGSNR